MIKKIIPATPEVCLLLDQLLSLARTFCPPERRQQLESEINRLQEGNYMQIQPYKE